MNIILYNHKENQGITAFLAQSEIVYTLYNYNGVDLTMPQGVIRVNADIHVTHFATTIAGRLYICKITGIKAINASVITYNYVIDYLKDYAAQTAGIGRVFCKAPIKREWNGTDLSRWARWIDDPLYQSYGGTDIEYYRYGWVSNRHNYYAITVSNGLPPGTSNTRGFYPLSVYIVNWKYMARVINYLTFGTYASAFYKQIVSCYALPDITEGDGTIADVFTGYVAEDISFFISGDWEFISSQDVTEKCWLINHSTGHGHSEGPVFKGTLTYTTDLYDFRDIYRTSYYWQMPGFPPIKVPTELYMPVAASQTTSYECNMSLYININPVDGYMTIGIDNPKLPLNGFKCALPSVSLPSGDVAFSINAQEQKIASTAFTAGTSAMINYASGNYAGVVNNGMQMATALFNNSLQNEQTQAAGNSYSNARGYDIQTYSFYKMVAVKQLFRENYTVFAANRGYIPYGPIVEYGESIPADAYTLLSGKSILYDTEAMDFWIDDDIAANEDYYSDLLAAMTGTVIHFNAVYVPTF